MSYLDFMAKPWSNSHPAYEGSVFSMSPAPESATGEVILASLYRSIGFALCSESKVSGNGRSFSKATLPTALGKINNSTWSTLLKIIVDSPRQPNQSSMRFLSLNQIVPQAGLYSGSARLQGNPWNPGALVQQIIRIGSADDVQAKLLWKDLFHALSVSDGDDVWAIWLDEEFNRRSVVEHIWEPVSLSISLPVLLESDRKDIQYPAKRFVQDLRAVIGAKSSMTRRQWMSLLESTLRLGVVSHTLWVCNINHRIWRLIEANLAEELPDDLSKVGKVSPSFFNVEGNLLVYGNKASHDIKNIISSYCAARLGINLVLWSLHKLAPESICSLNINSLASVDHLIKIIKTNKDRLKQEGMMENFYSLRDKESKTISCKRNIGSNIIEFCQYTLGQRQTVDELLRGYDQGYFIKKRNESKRAPWIIGLGPVAVLAMTHCTLYKAAGPRSIQKLINHMKWYGMEIRIDHVVSGDLGVTLRQLGLVLDSADAESGMLLEKPFEDFQAGSLA